MDGETFTSFDFPGTYRDTYAWDINNRGQIVGYYSDSNHVQHSFLATPVPEPTTMLLLGLGIAGLGAFRITRRKK